MRWASVNDANARSAQDPAEEGDADADGAPGVATDVAAGVAVADASVGDGDVTADGEPVADVLGDGVEQPAMSMASETIAARRTA